MRINLFLFAILLPGLRGYSQGHVIDQLPIVYKQNNVKARIQEGQMKVVNYFDHSGLLIETVTTYKVMFNKRTKRFTYSEKFEYDSVQNLIRDTYYSTILTDTLEKRVDSIYNITEIKLEHDILHRLSKIIYADTSGRSGGDISFSYAPYIKTRRSYVRAFDSSVRITQYDEHFQEKSISDVSYEKNGRQKCSSFMEYKNSYDKAGKIKKRKVKTSFTPFDSEATYPDLYPAKYGYTYLPNGLLREIRITSAGGKVNKETFEYEYW